MKTKIKDLKKSKKQIKIEVDVSDVDQAFKMATKQVQKKASVKGFRKGKVPPQVLEKMYGGDINVESLNHVVHHSFEKVLAENKLVPLMQPKFDLGPLEKGKSYSYEATFEVRPEFDLKKYKEVPLKKKEAKVDKEEYETELNRILQSRAELTPAEDAKALTKGLVGTIDFEGKIDGQLFEGGSAKGYQLEQGAGTFLKEFEDQCEGMAIGEKRVVQLTFPDDYFQKDLQGKKAEFDVELISLHNKNLPKPDDEFAKDLGKENFDEVKKEIENMIIARKEKEFRHDYADQARDYLLKQHRFDVPEGLLEEELKAAKKEKDDVVRDIKIQFVLEKIAEAESIQVQPQELEMRFRQLSAMFGQPAEAIKSYYQQNKLVPQLIAQLALEKTLDFVIDQAKFG